MKITKIETQKNKKNRSNIYIDDEFYCGVNKDVLLTLNLYEGKEVTKKDLESLLGEEEYQKGLTKAFDLLSRRLQSEKELRTKMWNKFSREIINKVIDRLKELGYVSDENFAKTWVEQRAKNRGKRALSQELRLKGIDKEIIDKVFEEFYLESDEKEFEVALNLVQKKKWPEMTKEERYKKLGGFLARKGFNYEVIKRVINEKD